MCVSKQELITRQNFPNVDAQQRHSAGASSFKCLKTSIATDTSRKNFEEVDTLSVRERIAVYEKKVKLFK